MKSYASVDRLEGSYVVFEVEFVEIENSHIVEYLEKDTEIMNAPLYEALKVAKSVSEGDIFVVEHTSRDITEIYYKDNDEKSKRIAYRKSLEKR